MEISENPLKISAAPNMAVWDIGQKIKKNRQAAEDIGRSIWEWRQKSPANTFDLLEYLLGTSDSELQRYEKYYLMLPVIRLAIEDPNLEMGICAVDAVPVLSAAKLRDLFLRCGITSSDLATHSVEKLRKIFRGKRFAEEPGAKIIPAYPFATPLLERKWADIRWTNILEALACLIDPERQSPLESPAQVVQDYICAKIGKISTKLAKYVHGNKTVETVDASEPISFGSSMVTFLQCFPGLLPEELIYLLEKSSEKYHCFQLEKIKSKIPKNRRGIGWMHPFGISPRNVGKKSPFYATEKTKHCLSWRQSNLLLFQFIRSFIETVHPECIELAAELGLNGPYFPFTSLELNYAFLSKRHTDAGDYLGGFNLIVPFGKYEGGELQLEEIGLEVVLRPGDVAILWGLHVHHWVKSLKNDEDIRHSLVFYNSQKVVNAAARSKSKTQ